MNIYMQRISGEIRREREREREREKKNEIRIIRRLIIISIDSNLGIFSAESHEPELVVGSGAGHVLHPAGPDTLGEVRGIENNKEHNDN